MWGWVDLLGEAMVRAGVSVAIFSGVVLLAMLGCRQPARRIVLAPRG